MHSKCKTQSGTKLSAAKAAWMLIAVFFFVAAGSLQNSLVGYMFAGEDGDVSAWMISSYFAGFILGAIAAPYAIRRLLHTHAFIVAAVAASACFFWASFASGVPYWIIIQASTGAAIAVQYVVVESWVNLAARPKVRARFFSLYMVVWFVAAGIAPLFLSAAEAAQKIAFLLLALASIVTMALMARLKNQEPRTRDKLGLPILPVMKSSGLGFAATIIAGASFAAALGLTSAYGHQKGLPISEVSLFATLFIAGGACLQFPIGWASDQVGRYVALLGTSFLAAISAAGLAVSDHFGLILLWGFLLGGTSLSLYSVAVALVHENLANGDRLSTSSGLLLLNGSGSFFGPLLVAALAPHLGVETLTFVLCGLHFLLGAFALVPYYREGDLGTNSKSVIN